MFYSKKLNKFPNLKHCFFSRNNGYSDGLYKSLNCGIGSNDKKENILKNLEFVCQKIECEKDRLITLNQRHTNSVIFLDEQNIKMPKMTGDAIVTKIKNLGIGVLTADCVPILLYEPNNKIIGCIHSGWKGALNGVLTNTINKFIKLGSNIDDLIAVIGPCIKQENYEVKDDFYKKFLKQNQKYDIFFDKTKDSKYFFNLRAFINKELGNLHVKNIENIDMDTFSQSQFFYSYRRSCFNKEKDYGRCISVILMT